MFKKTIIGRAFIMSVLTLSVLTFWGCTESKAKTAKDISPFEYKIVSEGENTCRISEIRIKKNKGISELKIPGTINGKTVISIGEGKKTNKWNDEVKTNAFIMHLPYDDDSGKWDWISESKVQERRAKKI